MHNRLFFYVKIGVVVGDYAAYFDLLFGAGFVEGVIVGTTKPSFAVAENRSADETLQRRFRITTVFPDVLEGHVRLAYPFR